MIKDLFEIVGFAEELAASIPADSTSPNTVAWMKKARDFAALGIEGDLLKPDLADALPVRQRGDVERAFVAMKTAAGQFQGRDTANAARGALSVILSALKSIPVPEHERQTASVFYSWQSDLDPKLTRNFIEDALERAVRQINKELTVEESPRDALTVDKDTKGIPGSPPIVDTIFEKISRSTAFVGDVTFVGLKDAKGLPNPNVLVEYGWALSKLGYLNVTGVMNTAFGKPSWDSLPFNMRHLRWPLRFHLTHETAPEEKAKVREGLVKALRDALVPLARQKTEQGSSVKVTAFQEAPATWSPSVFWEINEPFARIERDAGASVPINIIDGEHAFLRLIPSTPIEPLNPTVAMNLIRSGGLRPMSDQTSDMRYGRNRYGAFVYTREDGGERILMVSQLLRSGEIWGIDGYAIEKKSHMQFANVDFGYIPCSAFESVFVTTLANYLEFARRTLNLALPLRFVAGATKVQGYKMALPSSWKRFDGDVVEPNILYSGTIDSYDDQPLKILRSFFDHVWRECGLTRPDVDVIV